jgi:polar amino acid transport system ATP-binding protein
VITLRGVKKTFDGRVILRGVDLEIDEGGVTSLLGPSGSGKSTLLRCINGLERFDEGSIAVGDAVYRGGGHPDDPRAVAAIRRACGMVFQQFHLFAHLTAEENVALAPEVVAKLSRAAARDRARDLLEKVGLSSRAHALPRELSGGEQQRVAIARALAMEPRALLLDEPTSALDPERKGEVMDVLAALAEAGTTMVLVTHEPAFARALGGRVVVLRDGALAASDARSEPSPHRDPDADEHD